MKNVVEILSYAVVIVYYALKIGIKVWKTRQAVKAKRKKRCGLKATDQPLNSFTFNNCTGDIHIEVPGS